MSVIRVAVVEDNKIYRMGLVDTIDAMESMECVFSSIRAEELMDWLKAHECDVIILDIKLPGMSGVDAVEVISKSYPDISTIMLTSMEDDDNIFNALCFGANGYLLKSSQATDIEKAIHAILNGGAVMTPYIASRALNLFTKYTQPRKDYGLTLQERKILEYVVNGISKKEIADLLFISFYTVDKHMQNIYEKLQIHSQIELVSKAIKERLV